MSNAVFKSMRSEFNRRNQGFIEMCQQRLAMNIEVVIKTGGKTPVDTGEMKSQVRHFRYGKGFRVEANAIYSAVQEVGQREGYQFKNYTTAGTGAGWFQDAIDRTLENRDSYIMESARANGLL